MPDRIVRPLDIRRVRAAQYAALQAWGQAVTSLGPRADRLTGAQLFGASILAADDVYGHQAGWVTQAQALGWQDLDALRRHFAPAVRDSSCNRPGAWRPDCVECQAVAAWHRLENLVRDWLPDAGRGPS